MKKYRKLMFMYGFVIQSHTMLKIFNMARLTVFLILAGIIQVLAVDSYSQSTKLTLNFKDTKLEKVLGTIEDESEFFFLYNKDLIDVEQRVDINAVDKKINEVLDLLLEGKNINYFLFDRQIVLSNQFGETGIHGHNSIAYSRQQRAVSGKITDSAGQPLPGVSVVLKGTTQGTVTDSDGNYLLSNLPADATLVFSFVGMRAQEVFVGNRTSIDVRMEEEVIGIEEVVAVGYGTVRKSDLTGSVSSVKTAELVAVPKFNVLQSLQGRAAGVHVKQNSGAPGGATTIRIRGTNSIQGGNDPLYVIDGFPSFSSNPTMLDVADIESVEILKDASAIAIYGSRGSNGVIIITTKKGKEGKTKVDFDTTLGYQKLAKKMDIMNAREYAEFTNIQRVNDGLGSYFDVNSFDEGFDWQDFMFSTAPIRTHSLSVSGGGKKTKFAISGTIFDQEGMIKNGSYNRYSLRANIDHEIGKRVTMSFSSAISRNTLDSKNSEGGRQGVTLISAALTLPPIIVPYNDDGTYKVIHTAYPWFTEGFINPLNIINELSQVTKSNKVLTNVSFTFEPIDGLFIKILGGVENSDDRYDYYRTLNYYNSVGNASITTTQAMSLLNENTVSYIKDFGKHKISAVAGFTYQDYITTNLGGSGTGFLSDLTETGNLGGAATPGIPSSSYSKWVLLSTIARVNYVFYHRFFFTFSFRADGSSRYSEGDKWGYFPSGALAWRISEEQFMKNVSLISDLKLRTSYGVTGSQAISAYATLNNLSSGKTVFGTSRYTTFAPGTRLPGNLKWENTEQFDLGLDVGIMDNRFRLTADYYIKETRDLLNTVSLPSSMGYTTTLQNVGQIQNKGFEFTIDADVFKGGFQWMLNGNISFNKSKVIKLYGGEDIYGGYIDFIQVVDNCNLLREGEPMGVFYGYLRDGYTDDGFEKYKDLEPDGVLNQSDKTIIGDPNPKFIYGLNSLMSYKNFNLSLFFQGSQGNDLLNATSIDNTLRYTYGHNQLREVLYNHWTPETPNAKYPKITRDQTYRLSDRLVENGSYLRLKNVELAYNLPIKKWYINWVERVKLFVSIQNVLTITNYSGWDPDVNSQGGGIGQGIDHNPYPIAKSYTFGINVGF